jgi:hypothetical protein
MDVQTYCCEQRQLFGNLQDLAWFRSFIQFQYKQVVFSMEPIVPVLSDYWISQAHYRWTKDINSVREKEYAGGTLDHFKSAGFLCYWLRRCPPLSELTTNLDTTFAGIRHREPNKLLIQYGNVFAAFDIGLRICRYWESARTDIAYPDAVREAMMKLSIPQRSEYISDICYTLAEKNISPHSLNMLYKSLFLPFRLPLMI